MAKLIKHTILKIAALEETLTAAVELGVAIELGPAIELGATVELGDALATGVDEGPLDANAELTGDGPLHRSPSQQLTSHCTNSKPGDWKTDFSPPQVIFLVMLQNDFTVQFRLL